VKKQGIAVCVTKNIILQITAEREENRKKLVVIMRETYVVVFMNEKKNIVEKINPGRGKEQGNFG
jgi:hypothetical protein